MCLVWYDVVRFVCVLLVCCCLVHVMVCCFFRVLSVLVWVVFCVGLLLFVLWCVFCGGGGIACVVCINVFLLLLVW